jgi:hypothetical protein
LLRVPAGPVELGKIVLGKLVCVQQRRGDNDAPNAKGRLLNPDSAFSDHQELGERIVSLLVERARFRRLDSYDYMIIIVDENATAKVGRTV